MLDIRFIRENPELVRENIRKKFQDKKLPLVDEVLELDEKLRAAKTEANELRANRNALSKKIGMLMGQAKKDPSKLEEAEAVKAQVKADADRLAQLEEMEEKLSNMESANTTVAIDSSADAGDGRDVYFADAARLLMEKEKGSIGMLQRYFKIGFNRAARIMDQLEEAGIVGPEEGTKPRRVLMSPEQFEQYEEEYL